jgi:phage-related minor tail protein
MPPTTEERIAKLEAILDTISDGVKDLKCDMKEIRQELRDRSEYFLRHEQAAGGVSARIEALEKKIQGISKWIVGILSPVVVAILLLVLKNLGMGFK